MDLFADSNCSSQCAITITPPSTSARFHVLANNVLCGPFHLAVFRISGLPPGATGTMNTPGIAMGGHPFGLGVRVRSWPSVYGPCLLLLTVDITLASPGKQAKLQVAGLNPPPQPVLDCPFVANEEEPTWPFCLGGGTLAINGPDPCLVPVPPATWIKDKTLFC